MQWVQKLCDADQLKPVAFLEHVSFDETALKVRLGVEGDKETQTGRVFVVEQRWKMLLQQRSMVGRDGAFSEDG